MWEIRSVLASVARGGTPLSMCIEEYEWLYRLAELAAPPFLDIGTHYGLSALVMSTANPRASVVTVDNLVDFGGDKEGAMPQDCGRLVKARPAVKRIIGDSRRIVPALNARFGLALIDGSHWEANVAADMANCRGVPTILVHDALSGGPAEALRGISHRVLPAERTSCSFDIQTGGLALLR